MFEALFKYTRADYLRSEVVYLGDWPGWLPWTLALIAAAAIAGLLIYRRRQARWFQLLAIGALQAAMTGVVLWALAQPNLSTERLREGDNTIALVLDTSESMAYGSPGSRFDVARASLSAALEEDDTPDLSLRFYEMAESARPVDHFLDSAPAGAKTSVAATLTDILNEARFNPLAAVVLSSDGADTSGGLTAEALASIAAFGVPVHTIGVGAVSMTDDLELVDVSVPGKALPGSTVAARVTILHDAPATANVKVYDGDELVELVAVELLPDAGTTSAWIDVTLADAGPHELAFSVERADTAVTEAELRNNARAALVNVASQQYRILYFEGEPRWEYKFMRRAVQDDEDLGISTLLRVSPNKFYRQGIESPDELAGGFPDSRDALFAYHALIIGSVEAASLSTEQQELIRDFVSERGGSLLMLAGPSGLGNGGWGQSAIADVLPVRLPASTANSFHRKKAGVVMTPQGAGSLLLRLDSDIEQNRQAWQALPEVADYQATGEPKPAAMTLLNAATELGEIPLFITQPYGRGHAYVLATGGTWRWQMSMPLEDLKHETFWRQVLRAMVASAPDSVSLSASSNAADGAVSLRAEFRDAGFRPVDNIGVTAVASHESGESVSVVLQPGGQPGAFTGRFEPSESGTWYIEAVAQLDGEPVAVSRSSVLYESGQAEYFGIRSNPGLLQRLSAATGGRYFEPGDLSALPDLLRYSSAGITETEYRPIWDAPIVFILLLLLKGGEWMLRRRWKSI